MYECKLISNYFAILIQLCLILLSIIILLIKRYLEEPKRKFSHVAAHECKKFSYRFTIPHGEEIKNRMFKVNPVTKEKIYAKPTPQTKSVKDITEITWKKESLKQYEEYEFLW